MAMVFIFLAFGINEILAMISERLGLNTQKGEGRRNDSVATKGDVFVPRKMSLRDELGGMPTERTKETSLFHLTGTENGLRRKKKKIDDYV